MTAKFASHPRYEINYFPKLCLSFLEVTIIFHYMCCNCFLFSSITDFWFSVFRFRHDVISTSMTSFHVVPSKENYGKCYNCHGCHCHGPNILRVTWCGLRKHPNPAWFISTGVVYKFKSKDYEKSVHWTCRNLALQKQEQKSTEEPSSRVERNLCWFNIVHKTVTNLISRTYR